MRKMTLSIEHGRDIVHAKSNEKTNKDLEKISFM